MNRFLFSIEKEDEGERLDGLLSRLLPQISRSYVQRLMEDGKVSVNGRIQTVKKYKVSQGDQVEIQIEEPKAIAAEPEDLPLDIVYEDDQVLVVNKPKGMVVHPAAGTPKGTLVNAVLYHCGDSLSSINGMIRPGIVHRIDKDTSGLLMIAKTDEAHGSLAAQLEAHTIRRAYRALVYHNFNQDEGTVDAPIGRDPGNRLRMAVVEKGGRQAVTHYRVLERFGAYTYIEARLETGRTHQIRVHMAHIKHPLVGDPLYGPKKQALGASGQLLHAKILGFRHPKTGEYLEFESPLPQDFQQILERLRQ